MAWSIASAIVRAIRGRSAIRNGQGQGQTCRPRAAWTVAGTGLHGRASGLRRDQDGRFPRCRRLSPFGRTFWRYADDLTEDKKRRIISVLAEGARNLGFWEQNPWGEIIEDRGSQITYSALGQRVPADAKHEWDRDGSKKRELRDYAAERLPDLAVQTGGTTSVDVTRKGIDKAYGIERLIEQLNISPDQLLFIGDRLDEGGNDYPVRALGVRWLEVAQWQDTARYVQDLLRQI